MEQEKLEPNLAAKYIRHRKVFLKTLFFSRVFFRFMLDIKSFILRLLQRGSFRRHDRRTVFVEGPIVVKNPFSKLVRQGVTIGVALLIVTSFAPTRILETGFTADYFGDGSDFIEEGVSSFEEGQLLINEEGFIMKPSPTSEEVSRIGFTDSVKHTVVSGDTLSSIAALYGITVKTLVWENGISENGTLKIGQTLVIPSVDGVSHVVSGNETLSSIAKQYSVDEKLIKEHNNLEGTVIAKGQHLFIPGGKKKEVAVARAGSRAGSRNTFDTKVLMSSNKAPESGKKLIFPTVGKFTQGFRGGHYGQDIANPSKPDIWAADYGTVVTAKGGCVPREVKVDRSCGGGYGNYLVIDHGNGLQTLYGHMETLYVTEGQIVERGQAIGKMGNTGRAYGATGIHLHFEVIDNGAKKNPANYY